MRARRNTRAAALALALMFASGVCLADAEHPCRPAPKKNALVLQPVEPAYVDVAGLGWDYLGLAIWRVLLFAGAAAIPHVGMVVRGGGDAQLALSWPISIPFGPVGACTPHPVLPDSHSDELQTHRVVIEPSLVVSERPVTFSVRPGYRAILHRAKSLWGFGAGVGSTLELLGRDAPRPSLSPELLLHLGACCEPGYWVVAVRHDSLFTAHARGAWWLTFGLEYE
jgi:hypothetical protein